jgi:hypothetical protein
MPLKFIVVAELVIVDVIAYPTKKKRFKNYIYLICRIIHVIAYNIKKDNNKKIQCPNASIFF